MVFTSFSFLAISSSLSAIGLSLFGSWFSQLLFSSTKYSQYFSILFIDVAFSIVLGILLNLLRLHRKSVFYSVAVVSKLTVNLCLNIYLVAFVKIGIKGILISQLISSIFLFLILLPYLLSNICPKFLLTPLKEMLKYGVPLVLVSLLGILLNFGDRYVLNYFSSLNEVGLYSLGYKISGTINMFFVQPFVLGFFPAIWVITKRPNAKRFFAKVLTYFSFVTLWAVLALALFSEDFIKVFSLNSDYWGAYKVIPLICFSYFLYGVVYILNTSFYLSERTVYISALTGLALLTNIAFNFLLIPIWGVMGAAVATVIAYLILTATTYYFAQRFYPINYEVSRLITLLFIATAIYFVSISVCFNDNILQALILKSILLFLYPFALYPVNFYESAEISKIKDLTRICFNTIIK